MENLVELVDLRIAYKKDATSAHLSEDARQTPDVHGGAVASSVEKHLRSAVPERDDLVRIASCGDGDVPEDEKSYVETIYQAKFCYSQLLVVR